MSAHAADLMFVPWLRNPASDSCASGTALMVPTAPAMTFSIYQEEKQLQNAALKLPNLALIMTKEFSCVRECCGSDEDSTTDTAFCQPRLFSPTHSNGRDPRTIFEA